MRYTSRVNSLAFCHARMSSNFSMDNSGHSKSGTYGCNRSGLGTRNSELHRILQSVHTPIEHSRMYRSVKPTQNRLIHAQIMWPRLKQLTHL